MSVSSVQSLQLRPGVVIVCVGVCVCVIVDKARVRRVSSCQHDWKKSRRYLYCRIRQVERWSIGSQFCALGKDESTVDDMLRCRCLLCLIVVVKCVSACYEACLDFRSRSAVSLHSILFLTVRLFNLCSAVQVFVLQRLLPVFMWIVQYCYRWEVQLWSVADVSSPDFLCFSVEWLVSRVTHGEAHNFRFLEKW